MAIGVGLARLGAPSHVFEAYVPEVDLPVEDDEGYTYLRLIDPYDDTVFSSYQCRVIVADFERLATERRGTDTDAVLELVRRCADSVELCLWFIGD